jgi:CheY-like chemotaxis protein
MPWPAAGVVPAGRYTVISVADTGCGMAADTLAQACEPFFTTKGPQGTGLGLSMVQGFARQSGGNVHITSVLGEGTTVDLWLPAANAPDEGSVPDTSDGGSGRILVVDDSEDALTVVSAFLRRAGYDVISKQNGDLALAELRGGRRFEAIVTDFAMPGLNGVALLRLAREIDPSIPAMIMTGFTDPDVLSELEDAFVLRKPFNRGELATAVDQLIAKNRATTPPLEG